MRCPYCGGATGYYQMEKVHRALEFTWDGKPDGSSEDVEDYLGKRRYCQDCHRILPRKMFD